jgi:hypothetical protein
MKFTIIAGPGRCGSSALTQFFINSKQYRVDPGEGFNPLMKAGYESYYAILANSLLYSSKHIQSLKFLATPKISDLYHSSDIVKTPTFFYLNTYNEWQEVLQPYGGIQVILLTRNNLDDIFTSAKNIKSPDWDKYTPTLLQNQWNLNIQILENNNIPFVTMEYPKFSKDPNYLFKNLKKLELGTWNPTLSEIQTLSKNTFTT